MEHDQLEESSNHSRKVVITYTSSGAGRHSPGKATTWQDIRVTMKEGFVIFAPKTEAKEEASTPIYSGVQYDMDNSARSAEWYVWSGSAHAEYRVTVISASAASP